MALATLAMLAAGVLTIGDEPRPKVVTVQGHGEKVFLANAEGLTLYVFDAEVQGTICVDQCARTWPPLEAKASDKPVGEWTVLERPEGGRQWAYKGRRVYTFVGDAKPGESEGDQQRGFWHAVIYGGARPEVAAPAAAKLSRLGPRYVFTDFRDQPLYTFARDGKAPACKGECLEVWPPLRAPALAAPVGEWAPVDRPDGVRQWSYKGKLVYTYSEDVSPWEARGDNAGGVWKLVTVDAAASSEAKAKASAPKVAEASQSQARR